MKKVGIAVLAAICILGGIGLAVNATGESGFKVVELGGDKKIVKYKDGDTYKDVTVGETYPFGTVVKTSRGSTVDLELSEGNTFRLLPRSTLTINVDTKNPKLKVLKLEKGTVSVTLDKFPKGHKLQVETPTAVCGALGTRFTIGFEDDEDETVAEAKTGSRENKISCDKGQIFASSRFTINSIVNEGKTMNAPVIEAGTEMVAKVHEGLENSYTDISVTRGSLNIDYGIKEGGRFKLSAAEEKPARFTMAMAKSDEEVDTAVMEVKSGKVQYARTSGFVIKTEKLDDISSDDGPVLVNDAKVMSAGKAPVVADYLAAAKVEAEMHSKLVAAGKDPSKDEDLKAAAKKATDLRKQLLSKRVNKMLQQIRQGSRRATRPRF